MSFSSRNNSSLLNTAAALGVVFGNSDQEVSCALNHLKDLENNRLLESAKLREENFVLVEDASTVCSILYN